MARPRQQQQDRVGLLSACDDRLEVQPKQQVHKRMPSLVRYHTAVPKCLLGISSMTSDGRASSAQEHIMPSGRQSRNEYRYHTAVPTRQAHESMRARDEQHHKHTTRASLKTHSRLRLCFRCFQLGRMTPLNIIHI